MYMVMYVYKSTSSSQCNVVEVMWGVVETCRTCRTDGERKSEEEGGGKNTVGGLFDEITLEEKKRGFHYKNVMSKDLNKSMRGFGDLMKKQQERPTRELTLPTQTDEEPVHRERDSPVKEQPNNGCSSCKKLMDFLDRGD